jgi:hypothetical protein
MLAIVGALVGPSGACTNASVGNGEGEGTNLPADAAPEPDAAAEPDAAPTDAGSVGLTLTQSNSLDVIGGVSVSCFEAINSYYRVFDLGALGVQGDFTVQKVTFGVEECVSGAAGLQATVVLSTLDGELSLANLVRVASTDTVVPDVAFPENGELGGTLHEVPIEATVPAGSVLVVELTHRAFAEDQSFLVGANRAGETGDTFVRSPACGENEPTAASEIETEEGDPVNMQWVLVLAGQTNR